MGYGNMLFKKKKIKFKINAQGRGGPSQRSIPIQPKDPGGTLRSNQGSNFQNSRQIYLVTLLLWLPQKTRSRRLPWMGHLLVFHVPTQQHPPLHLTQCPLQTRHQIPRISLSLWLPKYRLSLSRTTTLMCGVFLLPSPTMPVNATRFLLSFFSFTRFLHFNAFSGFFPFSGCFNLLIRCMVIIDAHKSRLNNDGP